MDTYFAQHCSQGSNELWTSALGALNTPQIEPDIKIDGSVAHARKFDPDLCRYVYRDYSINLINAGWREGVEVPEALKLRERIYTDRIPINVRDNSSILEEQLSEILLGDRNETPELTQSDIASLIGDQIELADRYSHMVDRPNVCVIVWSVLSSSDRKPEAADFIHRDGVRDETILEPNSPILLRSYGDTFQFVRAKYVNQEKHNAFFERLLDSMNDEDQQRMSENHTEFSDPSGAEAKSFLTPDAIIETIPENHLAIFRTGKENGLYHSGPWPAGWRLNFQLSCPF